MMKDRDSNNPGSPLFERIRLDGDLSSTAARALLKLKFSNDDIEQMQQLSAKARAGSLSPKEKAEIETYEQMGCFLDILQSKARSVLKRAKSRAS